MAQNILFNGVSFTIPDTGDTDWGEDLTDYFIAIPQGALQKSGGNFILTADVNFGPNFGPIVLYVKSSGANIATAGFIRMTTTDGIAWRNAANSGNLILEVNASDQLLFNGIVLQPTGNYITALTGDVVAAGPGSAVATIQPGVIDNGKVSASAAIARTKLASGNPYRIVANDSLGVMSENAALTPSQVVIVDANGQLQSESALAISRGGTGQSTKAPAFNALSPITTKGDLIAGDGVNSAIRLAIGTDAQILTADSTQSTGIKWSTPAAVVKTVPLVTKYASGTGTHTPSSSPAPLWMLVRAVGGGGGGSGSGTSTPAGGAGTDTTFKITAGAAMIVAGGGGGGQSNGIGGSGGTASLGAATGIAILGSPGLGCGQNSGTSTGYVGGGSGGHAPFFSGGGTTAAGSGAGQPGVTNTGGGGGGAPSGPVANSLAGGGGGSGGFVEGIISGASLAGTFAYGVGTGGANGASGGSGAGGAGAAGYIEVIEYFQ